MKGSRCRDCYWWRVRKGCVEPNQLAARGRATTAVRQPNYWVYVKCPCEYFQKN